ncbi:CxC ATPase DNA modification system associated small protein [Oceanimonas marisflavi]|uniref:CxC ATPase DNA modification system associated small protein n=1 Tax=Oceanimonas marisflavi TaxID=2059724 RepID=UPI000D320B5F|nr:CxC ATPase DNA modification system associated small protein [Oceanimonas marisflavi]
MSIKEIKELLEEAHRETEVAHQAYSNRSAAHRAALQIMKFEKELYYGDSSTGHHLKKIREIIEINVEDIVNENN